MPIKLSHSAREMLDSCSEKYRLHYVERLRSPVMNSALFFGNALDQAFSRILLEKKLEKTPEELELLQKSEVDIFLENMQHFSHNGKVHELSANTLCDYYRSDFEVSLWTREMEQECLRLDSSFDQPLLFMEDCIGILKAKKKLSLEDKKLYNFMCWLSLCEKGKLMISAYREQILPKIHTVFEIQKKVSIVNAAGDAISGAIDFTASFTDSPTKKYICDNKSSSRAYKPNAVLESDQLATYCEAEGNNYAAYVVVQKEIFKKKPIIKTQIIKSEIKEKQLQETFDKFEQAVYTVEEQRFVKNKEACFAYGKKCPYYALCHHGKGDGLEKV